MKIRDYKAVIGTFRILSLDILEFFGSSLLASIKEESKNPSEERFLLDTGVSYNNDHILCHIPDVDDFDILTKFGVDHLSNFNWYLQNHLETLGRIKVEYGLVHFYEDGWKDLVRAMDSAYDVAKECKLIEHIGVSNFNIQQLEEYYQEFGKYPEVNEIEFSVLYHDTELVEFCNSHDIEVLGYGVLGGIHASKQLIREYTLDELISYAVSNNVTPILRSDCLWHLIDDYFIYSECKKGNVEVDLTGIHDRIAYELTESTTGRALNKFHYDVPSKALVMKFNGDEYLTLSSLRISEFEHSKVIPLKISEDYLLKLGYKEVNREFMMITDYLVRDKYTKGGIAFFVSDDCMQIAEDEKLISYVMINDEGEMIKSGSCHARVFKKEISNK